MSVIVLISVSLILYKTFASFTESIEFPIIDGKVDYFGNSDVYFVFYKGDELLDEMPQKGNAENLAFDHGECDNGASILWNESEWSPLVKGLNKTKTKCSLYFEEYIPTFDKEVVKCGQAGTSAVECIKNNANLDTINLASDETDDNNIRYIGSAPNNYIDIGDRTSDGQPILWRIIGVMNNIEDENNNTGSYLKIIRNDKDYFGTLAFDGSATDDELEWENSDIMKLINPNYENNQDYDYHGTNELMYFNNSLYWDRKNGMCYSSDMNNEIYTEECSFSKNGLSENVKNKIAKVKWNTEVNIEDIFNNTPAEYFYLKEKQDYPEKKWTGYVGLIYPSDYGYAVGGDVRKSCLEKSQNDYHGECYRNNWIKGTSWTMVSNNYKDRYNQNSNRIFMIQNDGYFFTVYETGDVDYSLSFMPVIYLISSTKIIDGNGNFSNPYIAAW